MKTFFYLWILNSSKKMKDGEQAYLITCSIRHNIIIIYLFICLFLEGKSEKGTDRSGNVTRSTMCFGMSSIYFPRSTHAPLPLPNEMLFTTFQKRHFFAFVKQ